MTIQTINSSENLAFLYRCLLSVDTLLIDLSIPEAIQIANHATSIGVKTIPFTYPVSVAFNNCAEENAKSFSTVEMHPPSDRPQPSFFAQFIDGETRALFGLDLTKLCDSEVGRTPVTVPGNDQYSMTYRLVSPKHTLKPRAVLPLGTRRILHMIGSSVTEFYQCLSDYYGFECIKYLSTESKYAQTSPLSTELYTHYVGYIHFDGSWSVVRADSFDKETSPRLSVAQAIAEISRIAPHAVQPHLFDYPGLTSLRSLFSFLNIPIIGSSGYALALSTNKANTLAVANKAGVPVAKSIVVRRSEDSKYELNGKKKEKLTMEDMPFSVPLIMKPLEEDNSLGVTLVRTDDELEDGLSKAFEFGDEVLVEQYVPLGKEIRVAVLENGAGEMTLLPILEYMLNQAHPIRTPTDKLDLDKKGNPYGNAKTVATQVPAKSISPELHAKLEHLAFTAHKALDCTDYSIFDVRVDPDDQPFMIESCLYCSFAPKSLIAVLVKAGGENPRRLFDKVTEWAIARREVHVTGSEGSYVGMKMKY